MEQCFVARKKMKSALALSLALSIAGLSSYADRASAAEFKMHALQGRLPIRTWKEMRDDQVIHQHRDFSCAAAALATLLTFHYGLNVTEDDVIGVVGKDAWLSMSDLRLAAGHYGFKTIGLAMDVEQLRKIKVPVIVYVKTTGSPLPHNAVLRGIDEQRVWLADPAYGNLSLTFSDFKSKWQSRGDAGDEGKVLVVLPEDGVSVNIKEEFFAKPKPRYAVRFRPAGPFSGSSGWR